MKNREKIALSDVATTDLENLIEFTNRTLNDVSQMIETEDRSLCETCLKRRRPD